MNMKAPFNLYKWIEDNKELLTPPGGNKNVYVESGDYIVMIVGGPNARKDYPIDGEKSSSQAMGRV